MAAAGKGGKGKKPTPKKRAVKDLKPKKGGAAVKGGAVTGKIELPKINVGRIVKTPKDLVVGGPICFISE